MKNYLFVMRHAPHSGVYVEEQLDTVLITAAFDQPAALLFLDDGVFQLKTAQSPEVGGLKDTAAIFRTLELYEVRQLFVELESLKERGLEAHDLLLPVQTIARGDVAGLMRCYDVISGL
jgi:tRNA 2-thiouridine synthesizing protein C